MTQETVKLDEPVLELSYPIHAGYLYVVETCTILKGATQVMPSHLTVVRSDVSGTVRDLWRDLQSQGYNDIKAIHRCDIAGRNLWHMTI